MVHYPLGPRALLLRKLKRQKRLSLGGTGVYARAATDKNANRTASGVCCGEQYLWRANRAILVIALPSARYWHASGHAKYIRLPTAFGLSGHQSSVLGRVSESAPRQLLFFQTEYRL